MLRVAQLSHSHIITTDPYTAWIIQFAGMVRIYTRRWSLRMAGVVGVVVMKLQTLKCE